LELGKVRDFFKALAGQCLVRPSPFSEKPRSEVSVVSSGSHSRDAAPSYADVLRKGIRCPEKEKELHGFPLLFRFSADRRKGHVLYIALA
jgi:hypothetical protein